MTIKTDPIYGHNIGEYKCTIPGCSGHVKKWHASLHAIADSKIKKDTKEKPVESPPQNTNPAHYHKGRRGKCKCDKPI